MRKDHLLETLWSSRKFENLKNYPTLLDTSNKATFLGVRREPSFLPCGKARGCAGLTFGPIDYA